MKLKNKVISLLLVFCLAAGLVPTVAFAADGGKTIMSGTSGIKDPTATSNDQGTYYTPNSYIYFGMNGGTPIKWRVLDADQANDRNTPGTFLFSEYLVSKVVFKEAGTSNAWQGSDAQTWCEDFASNLSNFSAAEQSSMLGIAKADAPESSLYNYSWDESSLTTDDKMFFLSVRELADYVGNYDGAPGLSVPWYDGTRQWWLRSPVTAEWTNLGCVIGSSVGKMYVVNTNGARPAFNLDLDAVLFTSAAEGGKPDSGLQPVSDYSGNEWKLTLRDSSRDTFTIVNVQRTGDAVTIYYNGAKTGSNEYISALIVDDTGAFTHYGRLAQVSTSAGMASFTMPELAEGSTMYIFNEQYNGDRKTDYASNLVALTIPADSGSQDGEDGREVELQNNGTSIQWQYVGETEWKDLVDLSDLTGADGSDGADGREVELRVDNGYIQWKYDTDPDTGWQNLIALSALEGMKGDKGDKGDPGEDGDTPTIGANGNWWIGGVDTGIPATGSNGADGSDGSDGTDGLTPYIGSNGNWWIGSTDTGIKATGSDGKDGQNGVDGQDGKDGVGIANIEINENGELVVTLTDGTEKNLGKVTGSDGVGITGAAINDDGELILTLSDGTELNAGVVRTEEAVAAMAAGSEQNSGQPTLLYILMGISGLSLAGLIALLIFLYTKRKILFGK